MLEEELRYAAARGQTDLVQSLLKQGAKQSPDTSGRTPLHLACAAGHVETVKLLLSAKNVNCVDGVGRSGIQLAASGGHIDVINLLIKYNANVNHRDTLHGNTALHEASWAGFSQSVAALAASTGAKLDAPNSAGFAPIHLACQNGHNQSCRELLLAGAHPDVQNNYGDTSLHTSARYGHAGVARILLSANCDVSQQNKNGDTPLHIAAAMGRRKLTTIFLEAGCDKTIRNKQNETALDIAVRKELPEIVTLIRTVKATVTPPVQAVQKAKTAPNPAAKPPPGPVETTTSDSDRRTNQHQPNIKKKIKHVVDDSMTRWSPYGCHYYPDLSLFPQPKLDSLPGEPLRKGEQYYLDLAGNICKGPVGVGLTCHCSNFVLDMESRLEHQSSEMRARIRAARARLEQRVTRTEGLLRECLGTNGQRGRVSGRRSALRRSRSLDNVLHDPLADLLHRNINLDDKEARDVRKRVAAAKAARMKMSDGTSGTDSADGGGSSGARKSCPATPAKALIPGSPAVSKQSSIPGSPAVSKQSVPGSPAVSKQSIPGSPVITRLVGSNQVDKSTILGSPVLSKQTPGSPVAPKVSPPSLPQPAPSTSSANTATPIAIV